PLARTEAVAQSYASSDYGMSVEPNKPSSAGEVQLFGSFGYIDSPSSREPRPSLIRRVSLVAVPLILLLATAAAIVILVPNLRQRYLPVRLASILGYKNEIIPMVSVQEYRISLDEKENSA